MSEVTLEELKCSLEDIMMDMEFIKVKAEEARVTDSPLRFRILMGEADFHRTRLSDRFSWLKNTINENTIL